MSETAQDQEMTNGEQTRDIRERMELAAVRLKQILDEMDAGDGGVLPEAYASFFYGTAEKLCKLNTVYEAREELGRRTLEELQLLNRDLYEDVLPEHYEESFLNPVYAVSVFGEKMGQCLSMLAAEVHSAIQDAFLGDVWELLIREELLLEIYGSFIAEIGESGEIPDAEVIREILYWFASDYSDAESEKRIRAQVDAECEESRFFVRQITQSDLSDPRYLYRYGCYITENEIRTARHLSELPEETIALMADTYTEGYRIGFEIGNKDLSRKKTVEIRYCAGFERMVKRAIGNFAKMGLQTVISRASDSIFHKRGTAKTGFYGAIANPQFDYDHREDVALIYDENYKTRRLSTLRSAYELVKEKARVFAGPACIEIFGEEPFAPKDREQAPRLSKLQQKLQVEYRQAAGEIVNRYIPGEERSFTIIAFPVPQIGDRYEEIFDEIIRINTLDYALYSGIQAKMIEALNEAQYVRVKGMNGNCTDLKIMLCELTDPQKQDKFENCAADVNIPVGEVFTTPVLGGTEGILHVKGVYLNELYYENLKFSFQNGFTTDYSCTNYKDAEAGRRYIRDNVLFHQESLPIGEFAVGTNTTAYVAARRFGIENKLPILIAEKLGPHFALGDTCYSHAEDVAVFNPSGREIAARDNEISIRRKTDSSKAYFNCHTDITIPYDELGSLSGFKEDGTEIPIIQNGRFVLAGCEKLNEPFDA